MQFKTGGFGSGASQAPPLPSLHVSWPVPQTLLQSRSATGTTQVCQRSFSQLCWPDPQSFAQLRVAIGITHGPSTPFAHV
jgi:hypothetical protein